MRALLIDDDARTRADLRRQLERVAHVAVVAELATFAEAELAVARGEYDLVFLEADLPGGRGLELIPRMRREARVIIVTRHDRYAARAFELDAVDYLLKPVTEVRLTAALRRVMLSPRGVHRQAATVEEVSRIFLKGAVGGGRYVDVREIRAIVSSENYTEVVLADDERCLVRQTMQRWTDLLPGETFVRTHRTTLINLAHVRLIERSTQENCTVRLDGVSTSFPVSRRLWPTLRDRARRIGSAPKCK